MSNLILRRSAYRITISLYYINKLSYGKTGGRRWSWRYVRDGQSQTGRRVVAFADKRFVCACKAGFAASGAHMGESRITPGSVLFRPRGSSQWVGRREALLENLQSGSASLLSCLYLEYYLKSSLCHGLVAK